MTSRQRRTLFAVLVPAVVILITALVVIMLPALTRTAGPLWVVLPLLAVAWSIKYLAFGHMRATDQAVDELKAKRFKLCIKCRYDLSLLEDEGVCPECGVRYTQPALEKEWRRAYPYYL